MFYQGTLQEGIALAVSEAKAVICFVRDDTQESETWEREYFFHDEFAQLLEAKSVTMRLAAGSQEAGFLTSFCPVPKFPAVVVIKNGMLREYFMPGTSKEDFYSRLRAVLEDLPSSHQAGSIAPSQSTPQSDIAGAPATSATSTPAPAPASLPVASTPSIPVPPQAGSGNTAQQESAEEPRGGSVQAGKQRVETPKESTRNQAQSKPTSSSTRKLPQKREKERDQSTNQTKANVKNTPSQKPKRTSPVTTPNQPSVSSDEPQEVRQASTPALPKQYRLQVRLFDGRSVRSSFSPSQTIRADVRPWLDGQMGDETRPYNLKHILTPQPNRTLTIADEEDTLEDLNLGTTANLVMIPIQSYTEAYGSLGSTLPVRAVNATYGLVSSAVGTATGLVGSLLGYGQTQETSAGQSAESTTTPSSETARRPARPAASRGPNIRTLRDQREGRDDNEFYNGNQLNFQPRKPDER